MIAAPTWTVENSAFQVTISIHGGQVHLVLHDRNADFDFANGLYKYKLVQPNKYGSITYEKILDPVVDIHEDTIIITGQIADLLLEHQLKLSTEHLWIEERISIENPTTDPIHIDQFSAGMQKLITGETGVLEKEVLNDYFFPIPFRHESTDSPQFNPTNDLRPEQSEFPIEHLLKFTGQELRVAREISYFHPFGSVPSKTRYSEGWAWTHNGDTLGIFKFNQNAIEYSGLVVDTNDTGVWMKFAGVEHQSNQTSGMRCIDPGQKMSFGVTRLVSIKGDPHSTYYAFRNMLDEYGCHFPSDYNPPVHWNQLYDMLEFSAGTPGHPKKPRKTREILYTKDLIMAEASKARDYSCESLYLDPGWDTEFGTFIWGEKWLGDRKSTIAEIRDVYGLGTSLHCPVAWWTSNVGNGIYSWPSTAFRREKDGSVVDGSLCMGSRQYLTEAENRLIENCNDGVTFIMFDGTTWTGPCWDGHHGHRTPYDLEEHCRANLELVQRIHAVHPDVIVEMHDMISSGGPTRYTPIYYKYGLPGSYDENWGFELMLQPIEDIRRGGNGRGRSLYYYNMACNVPLYLHIDLRGDNENSLGLWWFASTCRHFGIGGTHDNPLIAKQHRKAMQKYRDLERFYKRGEFFGLAEEVHIHVLPEENSFVVNMFNLSDAPQVIEAKIKIRDIGLDPDMWYFSPYHISGIKGWSYGSGEMEFDSQAGTISIARRIPPESPEVIHFRSIE